MIDTVWIGLNYGAAFYKYSERSLLVGFAAGCEVPVNSRKVNQKSPFTVTTLVLWRDKGRTPKTNHLKCLHLSSSSQGKVVNGYIVKRLKECISSKWHAFRRVLFLLFFPACFFFLKKTRKTWFFRQGAAWNFDKWKAENALYMKCPMFEAYETPNVNTAIFLDTK